MRKYTPEEVDAIVALVRENPSGFLRLTQQRCQNVTVHEVENSMRAWGITVPNDSQNSTNRASRSR